MERAVRSVVTSPVKSRAWRVIRKDFAKNKYLYLLSIAGILYYLIFKYIPIYGGRRSPGIGIFRICSLFIPVPESVRPRHRSLPPRPR
ncbi:hypothetical protein MJA45_20140 [Paenibacillus aurantius]|uniref:Uncharacterized protein n=1 Tax=Paenibacillus aurantius TaxID=2918900 RepID=A0AA96RDL8_9BACL|nr:hypothetical protein [Paenibacillus aurantius]WNQ09912.1 hypothetical protein MJA45_20140 [Paenibacillus aurantius]